jgi:hypothetical protein
MTTARLPPSTALAKLLRAPRPRDFRAGNNSDAVSHALPKPDFRETDGPVVKAQLLIILAKPWRSYMEGT